MRFKTTQTTGLLFAASDGQQVALSDKSLYITLQALILYLREGMLHLLFAASDSEVVRLELELSGASDAQWHYVMATLDQSKFVL